MEYNIAIGLLFVIMAGTFSGSFALPMKFTSNWHWENTWSVFSIFAFFLLPWIVAFATVPNLFGVYSEVSLSVILVVVLFGFGWGFGGVTFGLGLNYLGIALGFAIMMGMINSIGTLVPLIIFTPEKLHETTGWIIIGGISVVIVGILFCSRAGALKQKHLNRNQPINGKNKKLFVTGLIICIVSGFLSPMINFSFVFGAELSAKAIEFGANPTFAGNSIWNLALSAGLVANLGYCMLLLKKNRNWVRFKQGRPIYWLLALAMGVLWFGSIMFYGMGANTMGVMGGSVGWSVFQSMAIISSNIVGLASGEWKGSGNKAIRAMFFGLAFILIGVVIIGSQG